MIPDWIIKQLQAAGKWNPDGISRTAKARTHRCGTPVIVGLDEITAALPAAADLASLSALGEAIALLQGRPTYALRTRGTPTLTRRCPITIRRSPAGTRDYDVVAEHRCHTPPLPATDPTWPDPTQNPSPIDPPF